MQFSGRAARGERYRTIARDTRDTQRYSACRSEWPPSCLSSTCNEHICYWCQVPYSGRPPLLAYQCHTSTRAAWYAQIVACKGGWKISKTAKWTCLKDTCILPGLLQCTRTTKNFFKTRLRHYIANPHASSVPCLKNVKRRQGASSKSSLFRSIFVQTLPREIVWKERSQTPHRRRRITLHRQSLSGELLAQ